MPDLRSQALRVLSGSYFGFGLSSSRHLRLFEPELDRLLDWLEANADVIAVAARSRVNRSTWATSAVTGDDVRQLVGVLRG